MGEGAPAPGKGIAPGAPEDLEKRRTPEAVEACRKLVVRIFGETLPELTRSYRLVPDGMARIVIKEYLSSEKK